MLNQWLANNGTTETIAANAYKSIGSFTFPIKFSISSFIVVATGWQNSLHMYGQHLRGATGCTFVARSTAAGQLNFESIIIGH